MTIFDDIRKDREAGTPGEWTLCYEGGCTHLDMIDHPDMKSQMCDETYYPWVPDNLNDWKRIARVPRLERIALAAEELAKVIERSDPWEDIDAALAAFRAACGEGE